MHIQSCEYPKRIFNKYLGEHQYVPCGTCKTCRINKSFRWVQRINIESECHQYAVFFTLTYKDEFVPSLSFDESIYSCIGRNTDVVLDSEETFDLLGDEDSNKLITRSQFYVLNKKDCQNFIKRLRYHIDEKFKKEKKPVPNIRYYLVGEYGPTTFRPHYHGILWFDSQDLARCFGEVFDKAWSKRVSSQDNYVSLGRTDWSFVESSASSYVAQYLNCTSHLPKVLKSGKIRPFSLCSRRPPIGSLLQSSESISEIFNQGLVETCIPQKGGKPSFTTPLLPSLRNRLFPKCLRFDKISHHVRVAVYRFAERFIQEEDVADRKTCERRIKHFVDTQIKGSHTLLDEYFFVISERYIDYKPIYRAFDISKRVLAQQALFGCSLEYYVSRIELYYNNVNSYNLSSWYSFSEEYSKSHCYLDLYSADCDFADAWFNDSLSPEMKEYYGINSLSFDNALNHLDYTNNFDYRSMRSQSIRIYKDTTKTKKKNDYYSKKL